MASSQCSSEEEDNSSCNRENPEVIENPLVFHCCKCNGIIGDSLAWVCANNDLKTITLTRVTKKVKLDSALMTSAEGPDMGSTYIKLHCGGCNTEFGRFYKTTPRYLDNIRELFTLDVTKIESYIVGGEDQQEAGEFDQQDLLGIPQAQYLLVQLRKVQTLVVGQNSRIVALENRVGIEPNNSTMFDSSSDMKPDTESTSRLSKSLPKSQHDQQSSKRKTTSSAGVSLGGLKRKKLG